MTNEKKKQYMLAFAALMHDIGKFKQRAFSGDESCLSCNTRKMEGSILPVTADGRYTHRHALWTLSFYLDDFFPLIQGSSNSFMYQFVDDSLAIASASHHNPMDDGFSSIIAKADRISAGNDRAYRDGNFNVRQYLTTPMRPIFSSIRKTHFDDGRVERSRYAYPMLPLSDKEAMFPSVDYELSSADYRKQYEGFIDTLSKAIEKISDYDQLLMKMKDILLEYTWCIPSATNDYLNDISLYDHSITTMAMALAIYGTGNASDCVRACAIGVAGIQSFIFQSKYASFPNAAKIFRGRSFIVSILGIALEKLICERIGIIPFVDIYNAGGNITLILPDIPSIEEKLESIKEEVDRFLFEKYYGTLSILMDYSLVVSMEELGVGRFKGLYLRISRMLAESKNRKFCKVLREKYTLDSDTSKPLCTACGKHECANEDDTQCELCSEQASIGTSIPIKRYFSISSNGEYELIPDLFLSFSDRINVSIENAWCLSTTDESCPIWRLNNYTPDNAEFSNIALQSISKDGFGKAFLSYLKIDVDSLGELIMDGIIESEYSVSRFATLSRSLNYFFNTYINGLLRREFPSAYTVLSGGDDIFIILPWNQAIPLVKRIKDAFARFCCNNKLLHFSAGIEVANSHEPFSLANMRVNNALDQQAKMHEGKNAISFFDTVFSLDRIDGFIKDLEQLRSFIRRDDDVSRPITMGMLYRLYRYASDMLKENNMYAKYSSFSKLHYDIARNMVAPTGMEEQYSKAISFILDKMNNYNDLNDMEIFRTVLIYAIYESRKTTVEEDESYAY